MTDQEINRLISEACPTVAGVWSDGELRWDSKLRPVPTCFDPVNDLNAMHDAERFLKAEYWDRYTQWLASLAGGTRRFVVCHATARQRAEALLRTLGKWRE
jgi:hypothetical protein